MMRGKDQRPAAFSPMRESVAAAVQEEVWEVRPSGMLVQKRTPDSDPPPGGAPVPTIRVKVKYAGVYHEVYINSQASFGELKKLMSEKTGLHPDDQKVVYKDRERDSKAFLDMVGVKDRSKMTLLEDPTAQAKRLIEERRNAKAQRAAKAVSRVSLDVDKLASKVSFFLYRSSSIFDLHGWPALPWAVELTWLACVRGRCRRWRRSLARAARWWRPTWSRSPRR